MFTREIGLNTGAKKQNSREMRLHGVGEEGVWEAGCEPEGLEQG